MNTYEIIKNLAMSRKISIAELERTLDLSNGSISKWAKSSPNSEHLTKIADYFDVSVDYLLDREKQTPKAKNMFAFDGEIVTDEEYNFLKSVLAAKRAAEKNK